MAQHLSAEQHFDRVLQSGHGSAEQRKQETVQAVESLLRAESGVRVTSESDQQQAQGQQGITRFLELLIDSDRFQSYEIRAVFGQIADAVEKTIARGGAAGASNAAQSDTIEATLRFILDKIARKSRLSRGFEDEDAKLRYSLAEMLTGQRKKLEAAQVLTQMKLFDIVAPAADKEKQVNTEKVRAYVRIAELALDIGSKDLLDNYSARAGMLQHLIDDRLLDLRYRSCHARLLDSRSKFGDAAVRYVEVLRDCQELLSTATRTAGAAPPNRTAPPQLSDTERQELLSLQKDVVENAVACACLAPAGVGRTRLLGALEKEPRVARDASVCGFVHVLLEDRILTSDEAKRMQEYFATAGVDGAAAGGGSGAGGGTSSSSSRHGGKFAHNLRKAIGEHNITIAGRFYSSIRIEELEKIVGLSSPPSSRESEEVGEGEKIAANMIREGRLSGFLDHETDMLFFHQDSALLETSVQSLLSHVDKVSRRISP